MFSSLAASHPFLTLFLYLAFCAAVGVLIYFSFSFVMKKIRASRNVKKRVKNNDEPN